MPGPLPAAALQVVSAGLRGEGAPGALRGGRGAEGRTPGAGCGAEGVPSVCGAERIPLCGDPPCGAEGIPSVCGDPSCGALCVGRHEAVEPPMLGVWG